MIQRARTSVWQYSGSPARPSSVLDPIEIWRARAEGYTAGGSAAGAAGNAARSPVGIVMSNTTTQDVLIIGAGPAGSAAAALLAERGHRVLVIEREKFPRYHIGESLIPFAFQPLQRLGLIERMKQSHFQKKYSVVFVQP